MCRLLFGLFGLEYFFLLRPSRTLGVTAVAFVVVYVLMTKVYGGFDIGKRKSKPIVFSMALTLLLTDLVTHFLLCIMNTTVIHGGRFVYECPLLLLAVYMLQVALVIIMAYGGNDLYFKVNKPQRCLMVARRGECIEDLIKKWAATKAVQHPAGGLAGPAGSADLRGPRRRGVPV